MKEMPHFDLLLKQYVCQVSIETINKVAIDSDSVLYIWGEGGGGGVKASFRFLF